MNANNERQQREKLSVAWEKPNIAWAAGLFEGEGSIGMFRAGGKTPLLQLQMTDEDVIASFHCTIALGRVDGPYVRKGNKSIYAWRVTSFEKVQAVLAAFWPWLGTRRKKRALEILEEGRAQQNKNAFRQNCPKGHPLSGGNLYVAPHRVGRGCRICRKESNRKIAIRMEPNDVSNVGLSLRTI